MRILQVFQKDTAHPPPAPSASPSLTTPTQLRLVEGGQVPVSGGGWAVIYLFKINSFLKQNIRKQSQWRSLNGVRRLRRFHCYNVISSLFLRLVAGLLHWLCSLTNEAEGCSAPLGSVDSDKAPSATCRQLHTFIWPATGGGPLHKPTIGGVL